MQPTTGCNLFGSYRSAISVKDSYVLLHTTIGCNWGTSIFHLPSMLTDIRQASSVIYDEDIIFGGEKILKKAIDSIIELNNPKILFIISGCASEIIGEDFTTEIKKYSQVREVVYIKSPGFNCDMQSGQVETIKFIVNLMKDRKKKSKSINIIGLLSDDFRVKADINNIKKMFKDEICINSIIPFDTLENIKNAASAQLNVVFKGYEEIGELMKNKFNTPYIVVEYPYGIENSSNFIRRVYKKFNIDFEFEVKKNEQYTLGILKNIYDYLRHLYTVPCAVYGDSARASAMKHFLESEIGMDVQAYYEWGNNNMEEFKNNLKNSNTSILFGSSFERGLADELDISLIRFVYPVFDSISISEKGYAGFQGVIYFVEDLINSMTTKDYRREGQFM